MTDKTELLVIVGKKKFDDEGVLVVGALPKELIDIIDYEETERLINELKRTWTWTVSVNDYEWREVTFTFDTKTLEGLFDTPVIDGEFTSTV